MKKRIHPYLDPDVEELLNKFFKKYGRRYGDITRIVNEALRHFLSTVLDEDENEGNTEYLA